MESMSSETFSKTGELKTNFLTLKGSYFTFFLYLFILSCRFNKNFYNSFLYEHSILSYFRSSLLLCL